MPARDCVIRATCKQLGIAALVVVAAVSGIRGDAANAFLPVSTSLSPTPLHNAGIGAPKERLVRIARNELANVRDHVASRGTGRLLLNVDAQLELGVSVERTAPTRWGYSLSGRIDSPAVGFVTLVVHDEAVAGAIWTPDASYEVVHLGGGVHAVREVAADVYQCGGAVALSNARPLAWPESIPAGDENTVVDVLVVWTPQREDEAPGGADSVRASIELGIAYTNDAFERSGAFISLNLVGAEPAPDYEEPEVDITRTELNRLANPTDGHMDAVHERRDELGADLVSLATHNYGGIAISPGAFSVTPRNIWIVAHEFGHNFGLSHERSQWGSAFRTYPGHYEHGYATFGDSQCKYTIVSYGSPCLQGRRRPWRDVPFFSSPALYDAVDGDRLGMSRFKGTRGTDGPADAVLHLNRVRNTIADFRAGKPRRPSHSD